ncbi:MAG: TM2 domain-containing protein [Sphingomonadales bacterium]|nr:TM2 domain-containing protein [Sphingomonadales bacterium]
MKIKILILLICFTGAFTMSRASFPVQKSEPMEVAPATAPTEQIEQASPVAADVKENAPSALAPATEPSGKSQLVALLLAILVGAVGIHRFYLGYTGIGVIQLLTGGGCGIWALIDLIRIAMGDLQPNGGKYSKEL